MKVKLSLCLIKHHTRKTNGEEKVQLHTFVTSELYGDEWSVFCLGYFTRREKHPATHWIGLDCMVGPET